MRHLAIAKTPIHCISSLLTLFLASEFWCLFGEVWRNSFIPYGAFSKFRMVWRDELLQSSACRTI
jgi:hypothetical protein